MNEQYITQLSLPKIDHFSRLKQLCLSALIVAPTMSYGAPDPSPDPLATTVYLRTSCTIGLVDGAGEGSLENCFENMSLLKNWIFARANPQKLLVDIGPGTFTPFNSPSNCAELPGSDLSFRGAGAGKTIISSIKNYGCSNAQWMFSDLTVKATGNAVEWLAAGNSSWRNVVMESDSGTSWYDAGGVNGGDQPCAANEQGTHRFHSVRFITHAATLQVQGGSVGFLNRCGDDWLWGSEIVFTPVPGGTGSAIVSEGPASRIHLYGSNVRAEAHPTASSGGVTALYIRDGAEIHSHGVGIDVVANPGMTATALNVANGGEVHAFESSYFMPPQAGVTIRRIINAGGAGHIHAPFHWAQHVEAPVVASITGADTAVVINKIDGHPHMLIYDTKCITSPWFDMRTNACR